MDEYIKREDIIELAWKRPTTYDIVDPDCDLISIWQVMGIPAADVVERKRGKWIEYPEVLKLADALNDEYIGCSVCETVWNMMDNDVERFNFCPNCGADMREES